MAGLRAHERICAPVATYATVYLTFLDVVVSYPFLLLLLFNLKFAAAIAAAVVLA